MEEFNRLHDELCRMLEEADNVKTTKSLTPTRRGVYIGIRKGMLNRVFFVGVNESESFYPIIEVVGP